MSRETCALSGITIKPQFIKEMSLFSCSTARDFLGFSYLEITNYAAL